METVDTVLAIPPTDDSGAQTADRYEWQTSMAAAEGLAAYVQHQEGNLNHLAPSQIRVICEYHEDWIIQLGSKAELVSAKHREKASGPWKSITDLVNDGGIGHLFARWILVDRSVSTRLVTNTSTARGEAKDLANCRGLLESLSRGDSLQPNDQTILDNCLDKFCKSLMMFRKELPEHWQATQNTRAKEQKIPDDLREAARSFLLIHRFDEERPDRGYTDHAAPSLYAKPLLKTLGKSEDLAVAVWEAMVQLFRLRMRAKAPTSTSSLPLIGPMTQSQSRVQKIDERTVTLDDIMTTVNTATEYPAAFKPVPPLKRVTKLGVKMANGGCADTSIERAEKLKLDYSRYRRARRNSVPGSTQEIQNIERILHRIADEETHKVRTSASPWGGELWIALSSRLQSAPEELSQYQLDGDLSLGGIGELTSKCLVWFSDKFDVEAEIAKEKQLRGGVQ